MRSNLIHVKVNSQWKLTLLVLKNTAEELEIYFNSDNIEIMIYNKADEVIQGLFESLLNRCQSRLKCQ